MLSKQGAPAVWEMCFRHTPHTPNAVLDVDTHISWRPCWFFLCSSLSPLCPCQGSTRRRVI